MKSQIRYLKNLFYELLEDYGKAYLVVKHSEKTFIGKRGFTEEEKKKGLVLVFTNRNHKNLDWADDGCITTTLGFGISNKPEKCFLHFDDIVSVFSPEAKVKFDRWDVWDAEERLDEPQTQKSQDEKIVSLESFRKLKK